MQVAATVPSMAAGDPHQEVVVVVSLLYYRQLLLPTCTNFWSWNGHLSAVTMWQLCSNGCGSWQRLLLLHREVVQQQPSRLEHTCAMWIAGGIESREGPTTRGLQGLHWEGLLLQVLQAL
jgi:hypothetical protein